MNLSVINADDWITRAFQPEHDEPRRIAIELAAVPSSVRQARSHARRAGTQWGFTGLADTAELLVSELVTNAIAGTPVAAGGVPGVVSVTVTAGVGAVLIEVHDRSPRLPVPRVCADDAEHGRGLPLIANLSTLWGTYPLPGCGKTVWCVAVQDPCPI